MYFRIISFTLLAPSLWAMINQFKANKNDNLKVIKIAENKGFILESFKDASTAGRSTEILASMQSLKGQAMAKVVVEEGTEV